MKRNWLFLSKVRIISIILNILINMKSFNAFPYNFQLNFCNLCVRWSTLYPCSRQRMTYRKETILPCSEIIIKHPFNKKSFFVICVRKWIYMNADKSLAGEKYWNICNVIWWFTIVLLCLPSCLLFTSWM